MKQSTTRTLFYYLKQAVFTSVSLFPHYSTIIAGCCYALNPLLIYYGVKHTKIRLEMPLYMLYQNLTEHFTCICIPCTAAEVLPHTPYKIAKMFHNRNVSKRQIGSNTEHLLLQYQSVAVFKWGAL